MNIKNKTRKVHSDFGRRRALYLQIVFASALFVLSSTAGIYLIFSEVLLVDSEKVEQAREQ